MSQGFDPCLNCDSNRKYTHTHCHCHLTPFFFAPCVSVNVYMWRTMCSDTEKCLWADAMTMGANKNKTCRSSETTAATLADAYIFLSSFSLTLRIALIRFLEIEQQLEFGDLFWCVEHVIYAWAWVAHHTTHATVAHQLEAPSTAAGPRLLLLLSHRIQFMLSMSSLFDSQSYECVPRASFHSQTQQCCYFRLRIASTCCQNTTTISHPNRIDSVERKPFPPGALFPSKTDGCLWYCLSVAESKSMATLILIAFFFGKISAFFYSSYQSNYSYE